MLERAERLNSRSVDASSRRLATQLGETGAAGPRRTPTANRRRDDVAKTPRLEGALEEAEARAKEAEARAKEAGRGREA